MSSSAKFQAEREAVKPRGSENLVLETLSIIGEAIFLLLKVLWLIGKGIIRLVVPTPPKSVKGEVVLITGTAHGIGRELALQYASQGATVVCWDINQKGNAQTVEEIAQLRYPKAYAYVCDATNRDQVLEVAKKVQLEVGDVTILINNAGIMPSHPLLDHTPKEIELIMNINVLAHFWTLEAFLPAMLRKNQGHIVALSSCCGIMGMRNLVPYCASKYAVRGTMDALEAELRQDPDCQIKLTTIYPFMVNTGLVKNANIRFPGLTPILDQRHVAEYIISAQRCNKTDATVPRYLFSLNCYLKLLPDEAYKAVFNFLGCHIDAD